MKIIFSGGLGNQMFQYALYLSLRERDRKVELDTSLYSYTEMHNGYDLNRSFGIKEQETKYSSFYLLKLRTILKFKIPFLVHTDPSYFDTRIFQTKRNYIFGYWQSEKYFKQINNLIRESFQFKNIDLKNKKIAIEMAAKTSVSLHIRRGDYLKNSKYSGVCTEDYYSKAISFILNNIGSSNKIMFYIFSDDVVHAENFILKFKVSFRIIDINKGVESYKDMFLMSHCRHNIIANSSFSWWGAWLNSNPQKIVVAPEKWFRNQSQEKFKDIVPDNWIKL